MEILDKILPRRGYYCAARLVDSGGFAHSFFNSLPQLKNYLKNMDAAGHTMYVAQATFDEAKVKAAQAHNAAVPKGTPRKELKKRRSQENALLLRSFFFDIDCGEKKPYPSQKDGAIALKKFCDEAGLPFPTLTSSGNGLYAHWVLAADLDSSRWKVVAQALKNLCVAYGFKADPMRTSDQASVLRPAGTTNRKNGVEKPVRVLREAPEVELKTFVTAVLAASKTKKLKPTLTLAPAKYAGILDEFTAGIEGPPSSLLLVAERCAQIRAVRDSQGDVDEPLWYAFIGLARFTAEGKEGEIIHEWSQGHGDYSPEATNQKIEQHENSGVGPTTCTKFATDNPDGCIGCKHSGKIKSPIVLGRAAPEELPVAPEEIHSPQGFIRSFDGLYVREDDGVVGKRFYDFDLYPTRLAFDHSLGCEVVTFRHNSFADRRYVDFTLRSALLHDQKQLLMTLHDNHIHIQRGGVNEMIGYLDQYMNDLKKKRDMATLCTQMGWQERDGRKIFVLGQSIFAEGEEPIKAGLARNIPTVAKAFSERGSLDEWKKTTKVFDLPGMEPLAFAFLAGAFGSPLLQFTGFAGAMVALIGRSGVGKTLTGEWVMSVYGDPEQLKLQNADTRNSLVARLGVYGSLPIYIDEVSNIEGQDLSDLLYRVTQGRDKARLNKNSIERENLNQWRTVAIASSNHSLTDKLAALKSDPSAEINRVMEIQAAPVDDFLKVATSIRRIFCENSGTAGPAYIQYLVDHQDDHQEKIDAVIKKLNAKTEARSEERYWSAVAAVAIYGGLVAKKLGLIDFDVTKIFNWVVETIKDNRITKIDLAVTGCDLIGQYINDRAGNGLYTTNNEGKNLVSILREPRGPVEFRIDIDTNRLYIERSKLRDWLNKRYGSLSDLRAELSLQKVLMSSDTRKVLTGNTYLMGTQVPCWVLDLTKPALGRQIMSVVRRETEGKDEAVV